MQINDYKFLDIVILLKQGKIDGWCSVLGAGCPDAAGQDLHFVPTGCWGTSLFSKYKIKVFPFWIHTIYQVNFLLS